jgi:hypothetical protein
MRILVAVLLSTGVAAMPLLARNAGETNKEEPPAAVSSPSSLPEKPRPEAAAVEKTAAVKPEASAIESEMQDLRSLVEEQRAELDAQRAALKAQQLKMEALEEKLHITAPSEPVAATVSAAAPAVTPAEPSAATAAVISASAVNPAPAAQPAPQGGNDEVSPLQLKIGSAYITPVGFMDFTGVYRSKDGGSGIATNFGSIPFTTPTTFQGNLSEFRESMQNSRVGFRIDALVHDAHVIGYMESDYLGNNPGNVAVSSNSNTFRSRVYWVDVKRNKWEILGGQTWSLITPGRTGISPLPGDLFYSQNIDTNYQAGLVWGRIPEFRFVIHPTGSTAFAVALDSPEQYIGGSGGGGTITLPSGLTGILGANGGASGVQFNSGSSVLTVPNLSPDVIVKFAADPSRRAHFEVGGIERQFKDYTVVAGAGSKSVKTGGGGFINFNVELFKGFRLVSNNFYGDGVGRYIFGLAPDVIVRADGSISPIRSGSGVEGFEFTHGKSLFYGYYGGVYITRNFSADAPSAITPTVGYGFTGTGSSNSQNRSIQEATLGFNQTLWRDPKYGALNFIGQYSYLVRNPWASGTGPEDAHLNMVFLDLRYTLPGSAPTLGK